MSKIMKRLLSTIIVGMMILAVSGCKGDSNQASSNSESNGDLTFMIWDTGQKEGMEALAEAYTSKNPDVSIEVQVVNWDEYWTKLEAAAKSNTLPDIFWMHTNEFGKYASAGMLADLSELYDMSYMGTNFPKGLVSNATYDGKLYGIPKDWDTVALAYNKDLFDQANVDYPDNTWTWDDVVNAGQKIYDETGILGFAAPLEDQCGYLPYMYQAGGYLLNEDQAESGFTHEGTKLALEQWFDYQEYDFVPKQSQIAEADGQTRFLSGQLGMLAWGSWVINSWYNNYPDMEGKWDVAVLPKCPNPVSGDGRATIYNGLSFTTGKNNQNNTAVMGFLKFLGTEEAGIIQGQSGAAIPAFNGTSKYWVEKYPNINGDVFAEMMEYGVQFPNHETKSKWDATVRNTLLEVYNGTIPLDVALEKLQEEVDSYLK